MTDDALRVARIRLDEDPSPLAIISLLNVLATKVNEIDPKRLSDFFTVEIFRKMYELLNYLASAKPVDEDLCEELHSQLLQVQRFIIDNFFIAKTKEMLDVNKPEHSVIC